MEEYSTSSLYIVLKDHNHPDAMRIAAMGYAKSVRKQVEERGYQMNAISLKEGHDYSSKPCNFWITKMLDRNITQQIVAGVEKMKHLIQPKVINYSEQGKLF